MSMWTWIRLNRMHSCGMVVMDSSAASFDGVVGSVVVKFGYSVFGSAVK
eukprot:CAMPEP_0114015070 /NCGR_PEP_ID=MMETSP0372-20130328/12199_1 /TAXON_ID=340204 /ORGANISM="Lankesteria abbotti" /LENGTH=48 /assembly_acc=CAM_ASM_000359